MNGYEQILVVVLATFLAVFLVLGSIVLVLVIKLLNSARRMSEKANALVDKAGSIGAFFERTAGPVAFGKAVVGIIEQIIGSKNKRKG